MKPDALIKVCKKFDKEGVDFVIHMHARPWSRKVGAVVAVGPNGQVVQVPEGMWFGDDGVMECNSFMELMAKLRAAGAA